MNNPDLPNPVALLAGRLAALEGFVIYEPATAPNAQRLPQRSAIRSTALLFLHKYESLLPAHLAKETTRHMDEALDALHLAAQGREAAI